MEKATVVEGFVEIERGSCIDHTTTDILEYPSADELRFRPSYDAVSLLRPKAVASATTSQHGGSPSPPPSARPPAAIKLRKPSQSPADLVLDNAYDDARDVQLHDDHDHHDVIDVDDDDDDVIEIDDDDDDVTEVIDIDDDDDDRRDCSIVASSVGSNDHVFDAMDDDAVTSRHHIN